MATYVVRFKTNIDLAVTIDEFEDESDAADAAWDKAEAFLSTVYGHGQVRAEASLDGQAEYAIEQQG